MDYFKGQISLGCYVPIILDASALQVFHTFFDHNVATAMQAMLNRFLVCVRFKHVLDTSGGGLNGLFDVLTSYIRIVVSSF